MLIKGKKKLGVVKEWGFTDTVINSKTAGLGQGYIVHTKSMIYSKIVFDLIGVMFKYELQ